MLRKGEDDTVELECPECGARVETTVAQAQQGRVRCPNGHVVVVLGAMGGAMPGHKPPR
ncbi:MAG TPA: hypothetical protein VKU41_03740 [Polyangiaceae bacterium]|nr:hypothetical protein [Polyangiaceae bacterium]